MGGEPAGADAELFIGAVDVVSEDLFGFWGHGGGVD